MREKMDRRGGGKSAEREGKVGCGTKYKPRYYTRGGRKKGNLEEKKFQGGVLDQ